MDLFASHEGQFSNREPTNCLPDKLPMFTAREAEIQEVISFLHDERKTVVSLHGGPGFGKTAIAVVVSHKLSEEHNIPVIFSHLSTATSVDEMILRLCRDVGVNHEDNPKSALILWLKNIKSEVIFVMDDIDNLLEGKTTFFEFVRLLRKNSSQHCQIVTTSRTSYEIPDLSTAKVQVSEMDDESCISLLREQCPEHKDDNIFLKTLANLCGKIPLAMCIAGSQVDDFENSDELLQHLKNQPMKTLRCPERDQYVNRAINISYEMLDNEHKETLVRLAVFNGSFDEDDARTVVDKENLHIKSILKNLVCRNLIKQPHKRRYSIHLLIKFFLRDELDRKKEGVRTEALMVGHYLKLSHDWIIMSYSKNGYKSNREALKKEAHNIHNVLKICCQHNDTTSDISNCLTKRNIYTTSARFFTIFVRTIIQEYIVDNFLQLCAKLAEERKQYAIKIEFNCLLAGRERCKSIGTAGEYFNMMETIEEEFQMHSEDLKDDKLLCAHYYYQYGRYLSRKSESCEFDKQRLELQINAREQFEKSLNLRNTSTETSVEKADKIFSLLNLGTIWKKIATGEYVREERKAAEKSKKIAQTFYEEALKLSQDDLGEHELTSACYKYLGDQFLTVRNNDKAEEMYTLAKEMRENLGLNVSEKHVFLLKNLGKCLTFCSRLNEAIIHLETARETVEKLSDSDEPNACKATVYASLAIAHNWYNNSKDAVKYAKKALEFKQIDQVIKKYEMRELQQILHCQQRW